MGKFFKSRGPFKACPKCGKQEFGVLMVTGHRCVRRCNDCDFDSAIELPKPAKKIVYLDQNAISLMVKVPLGRAPEKWKEVRETIEHAVMMEAIACPHSEFHENESVLDKKFADEFRKLYQRLALGEKVCSTHAIEMAQIARALKRFVGEPETERPAWRDLLRHDPHVWTGDHYITLKTDRLDTVAVTARAVKDQIAARLEGLNNAFKENKNSFEDQRAMEMKQVAANMAEIYKRHIGKLMACSNPGEMLTAHMEGSIFSDQMEYVFAFFKKRGADDKTKSDRAIEFFASNEFAQMDYVRLTSALWAGLSRRVSLGQATLTASDFNDVPIIGHYAPYCDAMFIDNSMRALMTTNPVKDALGLKTSFFAPNCLDEFNSYIRKIVADQPKDFAAVVREVHGE